MYMNLDLSLTGGRSNEADDTVVPGQKQIHDHNCVQCAGAEPNLDQRCLNSPASYALSALLAGAARTRLCNTSAIGFLL